MAFTPDVTLADDDFRITGHTPSAITLSHAADWQLHTPDGRQVSRGRSASIDLSALPRGIYMLRFPAYPAAGISLMR